MRVIEFKAGGKPVQFKAIDEAIRTAQFIRNKAIRFWMDTPGAGKYDLSRLSKILAAEFPFADKLNSMARQSACDRAWQSIAHFYANCKAKKPGKKGYPRFQKDNRSVEYKTCGWKISPDSSRITFTDKNNIGTLKLIGTRKLNEFPQDQIKRVRLLRRADGYYVQFCINIERQDTAPYTGSMIGIDVGLKSFLTDSNGNEVENPRFLRKSERRIKKMQRRVSKKKKGSVNRKKARQRLGKVHLKVQRQRKDFATKLARALYQSHDLIAYENLQVKNMVKNHCLAKSINDASWSLFREKLEYYAKLFGKVAVPVKPHFSSQECSACGAMVQKTLSQRTHTCRCGLVLDRDHNSAIILLQRALQQISISTAGQAGINAWGENDLYLASSNGI